MLTSNFTGTTESQLVGTSIRIVDDKELKARLQV